MPPKGNDRQGESEPGEYGEHSVRDGHGGVGSSADDLGFDASKIKQWIYNEGTCMTIIIYFVRTGAKRIGSPRCVWD